MSVKMQHWKRQRFERLTRLVGTFLKIVPRCQRSKMSPDKNHGTEMKNVPNINE
jgi:hypothetical protein